jgi:hypothetical protein
MRKEADKLTSWDAPLPTLIVCEGFEVEHVCPLEAILMCKSFVRLGYRGERLIEPYSSWFPPMFPSG